MVQVEKSTAIGIRCLDSVLAVPVISTDTKTG